MHVDMQYHSLGDGPEIKHRKHMKYIDYDLVYHLVHCCDLNMNFAPKQSLMCWKIESQIIALLEEVM